MGSKITQSIREKPPHGHLPVHHARGILYLRPKDKDISDLVQLGFYLCLRSCEYTKCTGHHRTVQFLPLLEFVFFIGDHLIPANAPVKDFQHATQIVLTLDNHKNAIRGETVSHFRSDSPEACPV